MLSELLTKSTWQAGGIHCLASFKILAFTFTI
jgi:hypothetical protein